MKEIRPNGVFSGYASLWGAVDTYRERVERGAFGESLAAAAEKNRALPILWQHRTAEPIGVWTKLEEDERGLYGEGELWLDEAPYARVAHKGMGARCVTGLSIGYFVQDDAFDEKERVRTLKKLDLREVSIVTDPALEEARVDTVKAKLAAGERISEREFARVLRERGFSRTAADEIAVVGFKEWSRRETGTVTANSPAGLGDLAKALGGLSLPKIGA
ncbi:HK97 family phage prohead protease [Hansschlegelia quercus]|uniref:HK97 family phage prohead protease n=1 Tax=Hansschlegelia quercus TaxID=2528245 RepID=A0A4Q9GNH2_9HYPH|nr:HK97 family phage prohead protease [Hansschlegelia quercus]TBN54725.1 HK97 family phage prohead protease [Hansschlegelia quercus]